MVPPDEVSAERAVAARVDRAHPLSARPLPRGSERGPGSARRGRRRRRPALGERGPEHARDGRDRDRVVDEGVTSLRRAIEIAREDDDIDGLGTAYSNLADTLSLAGRTPQALETAKEGLVAVSGRAGRPQDWMALTVSDLSFEAGDWEAARAHLAPPPQRPGSSAGS